LPIAAAAEALADAAADLTAAEPDTTAAEPDALTDETGADADEAADAEAELTIAEDEALLSGRVAFALSTETRVMPSTLAVVAENEFLYHDMLNRSGWRGTWYRYGGWTQRQSDCPDERAKQTTTYDVSEVPSVRDVLRPEVDEDSDSSITELVLEHDLSRSLGAIDDRWDLGCRIKRKI
jgi:Flp pilus assembly protein TadG